MSDVAEQINVDGALAEEAERLIAHEVGQGESSIPGSESDDLASQVEALLAQTEDAVGEVVNEAASLDAEVAQLTEQLASHQANQSAEPGVPELPTPEGELGKPEGDPAKPQGAVPEVASAGVGVASVGVPAKAKPSTLAREEKEELEHVGMPAAPEPPAERVQSPGATAKAITKPSSGGADVNASKAAAHASAEKPAPKAPRQTPLVLKKLASVPRAVASTGVTVCAVLSKPVAEKPAVVRDSIAWIALCTLFCGGTLWAYALFFRKPVEIPAPSNPVVLAEKEAPHHGVTYTTRSSHAGGDAHGAKSDGHGGSGGHADAKKPAAKKDAGHGAKAEKKAPAKKDAAKKDAGHGGGH